MENEVIIPEEEKESLEPEALESTPPASLKQNKFKKIWNKIVNIWMYIWKNQWYPMLILGIILTIVMIVMIAVPASRNGFLHMNSDDVIQYYPYVGQFFEKIKTGQLSLYDINLFGGSSFFSGVYYIPLDIFTFVAFLISYLIPGETAYAITNFMRPAAGAILLYYTFSRRFSYKTAFIAGLIMFAGGTTEAYYIFPVYLGICVYAPLAMLVVDLCLEKKGSYYLMVPFYSVVVILYDFYIAYMLLAFISIYFVVELHITNTFSFFQKNCFLWNKESWKRFLEFFFFIFLGVAMAAFFLMPSAMYILDETNRTSSMTIKEIIQNFIKPEKSKESYRFFSKYIDGEYRISIRHYFTQWINLFIANDPHCLCLNDAGDYVREHASLYITSGGVMYLAYFFLLTGKKENRLKVWVLLMNILLCIPLFCVVFGLNSAPYVRWFFIPYMLNLYAAAIAMDKHDFAVGKYKYVRIIPSVFLCLGIGTIIYVLVKNPEIFIHYKPDNVYYYPLLIGGLIFTGCYVLILLITFFLETFGKRKNIHGKIIPVLITAETIFGIVIIFTNVDNTNSYYYTAKNEVMSMKANLREIYDYQEEDGYRINMYTNYGKNALNGNINYGNVNFGTFFQSFYNTELNTCLTDIYNETDTGWSRKFNYGYTLLAGPVFNMGYVVTNENVTLPEEYYTLTTRDDVKYYKVKDDIPFIVYDKGYTTADKLSNFNRQVSLLFYAYIKTEAEGDTEITANYDKISYYGLNILSKEEMEQTFVPYMKSHVSEASPAKTDTWSNYNVYYIDKQPESFFRDAIFVYSYSTAIRRLQNGYMYLADYDKNNTENSGFKLCKQMHYNTIYIQDDWTYNSVLVQYDKETDSDSVRLYSYDYQIYEDFLAEQNQYKDRYFSLDGSKMTIKCTMPEENKTRIIKTGYTYSKEWVPSDETFKTCNIDGGFLGIIVPEDVKNVDITVKFCPSGFSTGCKISLVGCILYLGIITPVITITILKTKKKKNEEEAGK